MSRERQVHVQRSEERNMSEGDFESMRNRFESEMRRVEEEMQRLRRDFESYTPSKFQQSQQAIQAASSSGGPSSPQSAPSTQRAIRPAHAYQTSNQHYREHQSSSGQYPGSTWTNEPVAAVVATSPVNHYGGSMQQPQRPTQPLGAQVARRRGYDPYTEGASKSPMIRDDSDRKTLRLRFNVSQYHPEEISVRTVDNRLLVQAKHEEKAPGKTVFREYNQEFMLPKGVRPEDIASSLSNDGVLTVEAPLPALEPAGQRPAITHR